MQRAIVAAGLAMLVLVWPVQAQLFPTPAGGDQPATGERVVLDAQFLVIPPFQDAPCMRLEAGTLTVRLRNMNAGDAARPTTFRFQGYRGEDGGARIETVAATNDTTTSVTLAGALYCWTFEVYAPVTMQDSMSVRTNLAQGINLRMTLAPQ